MYSIVEKGACLVKIAEVSKLYDISADTLRYYERVGLIPPIQRNTGGIREYSEDDLKRIEFVKCMRRAGLSIDSLVTYFELLDDGEETYEERHELLLAEKQKIEQRISEMQTSLDLLNRKIEGYEKRRSK